ncbi:hypothetical protein [uncultured Duncaniella sp.]|uniref:hypothetical protein n=1 Tax=uncultured Duncaniella sp. TaxID=2768039 RepID=UPI002622A468|nr:hypothetical protein [uncultured Duncaniella sp.]
MKKVILILVCAISVIGASATILFRACDKEIYTVGPAYFEDPDDAEDYYLDLADYLCGN